MNTVLMPMWLLSGSFYPASEAAPVMRWLTAVNPLTWSVEALRSSLDGQASPLLGAWAWPLTLVFALGAVLMAMGTIGLGRRGTRS